MIIFGIDPGSAITGYGAIRVAGTAVHWVASGIIETDTLEPLADRLVCIFEKLSKILSDLKPDRVSVENAFYAKNVHTTLVLGHARGVALLAARRSGATVFEYSPREIKKAVVGQGNATKQQVEYMVKTLVSPPAQHLRTDAYDALAAALCDHLHSRIQMGIFQPQSSVSRVRKVRG